MANPRHVACTSWQRQLAILISWVPICFSSSSWGLSYQSIWGWSKASIPHLISGLVIRLSCILCRLAFVVLSFTSLNAISSQLILMLSIAALLLLFSCFPSGINWESHIHIHKHISTMKQYLGHFLRTAGMISLIGNQITKINTITLHRKCCMWTRW